MNRKKVRNVHDLYGRHLLSRIPELARSCFEQTLPPPLLPVTVPMLCPKR